MCVHLHLYLHLHGLCLHTWAYNTRMRARIGGDRPEEERVLVSFSATDCLKRRASRGIDGRRRDIHYAHAGGVELIHGLGLPQHQHQHQHPHPHPHPQCVYVVVSTISALDAGRESRPPKKRQWNGMQCNAMRCDTMQCNSMPCHAMACLVLVFDLWRHLVPYESRRSLQALSEPKPSPIGVSQRASSSLYSVFRAHHVMSYHIMSCRRRCCCYCCCCCLGRDARLWTSCIGSDSASANRSASRLAREREIERQEYNRGIHRIDSARRGKDRVSMSMV